MNYPRELWLVRHGETAFQQQRRYCGHSDPPLAPAGIARLLALRPRLPLPPAVAVFSSDLWRATASARLLCDQRPRELPELREIHFGDWEGKTFAETGCTDPSPLRSPEFRFPGGESANLLRARVSQGLAWILRHAPHPALLIVAHGGSLAAILAELQILSWDDAWQRPIPHATALRLESGADGWRQTAAVA